MNDAGLRKTKGKEEKVSKHAYQYHTNEIMRTSCAQAAITAKSIQYS
jgi:hypothetical protein